MCQDLSKENIDLKGGQSIKIYSHQTDQQDDKSPKSMGGDIAGDTTTDISHLKMT